MDRHLHAFGIYVHVKAKPIVGESTYVSLHEIVRGLGYFERVAPAIKRKI